MLRLAASWKPFKIPRNVKNLDAIWDGAARNQIIIKTAIAKTVWFALSGILLIK